MSAYSNSAGGAEATTNVGVPTLGQIAAASAKNPHQDLFGYYNHDETGIYRYSSPNPDNTIADKPRALHQVNGADTVAGKVSNASRCYLTGDKYFTTADAMTLEAFGSFTVFGWLRIRSNPSSGNPYGVMMVNQGLSSEFPVFDVRVVRSGSSNFLQGIVGSNAGYSAGETVTHTTDLALNTWYFFALTLDIPNGVLKATVDSTVVSQSSAITGMAALNSTFLWCGYTRIWPAAQAYFADVDVDEQGWALRPLTVAELEAIRRNGNGTGYLQPPDTEQGSTVPFKFTSGGTTIANTTTETSILGTVASGSQNIPANSLQFMNALVATAGGAVTTIAAPGNVTLRLKHGSTTLVTYTFTPTGSLSAAGMSIGCGFVPKALGSSGTVDGAIIYGDSAYFQPKWAFAVSLDTTAAGNFDITWQWATADAGNSVTISMVSGLENVPMPY